jgi:AraC-like DNA-binding protein
LESEQIHSVISNADNGSEIEKINGDKYLVTWQEGESGLQYCVVQSIDIFQNKILTGQWGILALLILCAAPAALLIMWLSNNISKRLKHINGLLNEKEDASYDFDNIEAGIRTLVESNKEAKKESMPFRRTIFIGNFIRNEFKSEDEMLQAAEHVNIIVKNMYYIVVLMGDRENSNESKAHEVMLLEIEGNQFVDGYGFNLIHNNQSLFVLFSGDKIQIELMIQNMLDIGKKYCEDFVLAVSDYHLEYLEASKAYLEADTAFDSRFLKDNDKVIRYEDEHDRTITEIIPDKYLQGLKNSIRTRNLSEMEENINKICSQMKRENHSLLTFKILCNDIIHMMIAECNDRKINVNDIYSVFALSECLTIQDFNGILNDACRILIENQTSKPENEKDAVIEQAISYMNEHYQEAELNMGALADYLNISSVTLAVDFKNVVGRSPSDYLASIRMEHAKELLKQTDMRVKAVSFSVGYEDDHVFMRRFKKYTGMTPGQYRSEHEMEK